MYNFCLKKLKSQQGRPLYAKLKATIMTQEVEASTDYNFGNIWENEVSPQNTPGLECFTITFLKRLRNEIPKQYKPFQSLEKEEGENPNGLKSKRLEKL